jgi:hypothetical protein
MQIAPTMTAEVGCISLPNLIDMLLSRAWVANAPVNFVVSFSVNSEAKA